MVWKRKPCGWGMWTVMLLVGVCGGGLGGCQTPVSPLSEAVFRLSTTLSPAGCGGAGSPQAACRWDIIGTVDSAAVVGAGENPFQDCSGCAFNQKFGIADAQGGRHTLYYRLPTEDGVPLLQGEKVKMTYIAGDKIGQGYAFVLRKESGELLFAVTSGAGGKLLASESLGQFSVAEDSVKEAGSQPDSCGTKLYRFLVFSGGPTPVRLAPGQIETTKDSTGQRYKMANINRYNWTATVCAQLPEPSFSYFAFLLPAAS